MNAHRTLDDVNNLLLQNLYDSIAHCSDDSEALLNYTEAVAKLNVSFRNNDKLSSPEKDDQEKFAQEEKDNFASCAEAEIIDGNQP